MSPTTALSELLQRLHPILLPDEYVFCLVEAARVSECSALPPLATFREAEGLSAVLLRSDADERGFAYDSVHRCITLTVHSSLAAVGLTAAVATALAAEGLSANVIAAYNHDHVFVPSRSAEQALAIVRALEDLQR